jgi:TPP-dependent 2-oxoacid decarboxylase
MNKELQKIIFVLNNAGYKVRKIEQEPQRRYEQDGKEETDFSILITVVPE